MLPNECLLFQKSRLLFFCLFVHIYIDFYIQINRNIKESKNTTLHNFTILTIPQFFNPKQFYTFGCRNKIISFKRGAERPARIRLSRDEIKKTSESDAPRFSSCDLRIISHTTNFQTKNTVETRLIASLRYYVG